MLFIIIIYVFIFVVAAFHAVHRIARNRMEFYLFSFIAGMAAATVIRYLGFRIDPAIATAIALAALTLYDRIQAAWFWE